MERKRYTASGYTVLELLMTVATALILVGIATPGFLSWLDTIRLSSATWQIATDLRAARMKAISQNTPFQVVFSDTTYVIQKCGDPSCASPINDSGNIVLPEGIALTPPPVAPQFLSRGTTNGIATITLSNGSGTRKVEVNLVGRVRIQ